MPEREHGELGARGLLLQARVWDKARRPSECKMVIRDLGNLRVAQRVKSHQRLCGALQRRRDGGAVCGNLSLGGGANRTHQVL